MSAELNKSYQIVARDQMETGHSHIVDQMLMTLEGGNLRSVRLAVLNYFESNPDAKRELEYFLPWAEDEPDYIPVLTRIAVCYSELGDQENATNFWRLAHIEYAKSYFAKAKEFLYLSQNPRISLNKEEQKAEHLREAFESFRSAIKYDSCNSLYRREYAKALSENGYQEQAIKEAKLAIDVEDSFENNLTLLNVYAYALQMDEYKKIEREIERKFSDELSVRCWVAERNIKDGQYDTGIPMARAIFSKVSTLNSIKPDDRGFFELAELRKTISELFSTEDAPYSWNNAPC
ncbi:MAG TPA: hypothetical protein PLK94_07355 [Alphaproteobacteria bacterium]|nr:hypothetical protein [Alphaproteobacteria bacterium]HOO51085.1 hypothetical protein [Alphaproteobacteria bacterium]